jgi:hypothetical protein
MPLLLHLLLLCINLTFELPLEAGDGAPRHAALGVQLQERARDGAEHPVAGADGVGDGSRGRSVGGVCGGGSRRRIVRGHGCFEERCVCLLSLFNEFRNKGDGKNAKIGYKNARRRLGAWEKMAFRDFCSKRRISEKKCFKELDSENLALSSSLHQTSRCAPRSSNPLRVPRVVSSKEPLEALLLVLSTVSDWQLKLWEGNRRAKCPLDRGRAASSPREQPLPLPLLLLNSSSRRACSWSAWATSAARPRQRPCSCTWSSSASSGDRYLSTRAAR